ncbi:MAG TPA: tetratricopeptide repeat protein [Coleofasciculaceae cyanobacterium]
MFTGKFPLSRHLALAGLTGYALACLCSPVWAADGAIRAIQYDPGTRHFMIDASGSVRAIVNTLTIAGHKRVIVDIENAEISTELPRDSQLLQQLSGQFVGLRNVTVNQYGGSGGRPIVRILFDIESDSQTIRLVKNQGPRLELEVSESAVARTPNYEFPPQLSNLNQSGTSAPAAAQNDVQQPMVRTEPARIHPDPAADETKRALAQMGQRYDALFQEHQSLKAQLTSIRKQPVKQPEEGVRESSALRSEIERLKTTNANLQSQLNGLLASGPSKPADNTELQQKLADAQRRLDGLNRENASLKATLNAKEEPDPVLAMQQAEINRIQKANQTLQMQLDQARKANTQPDSATQKELSRLKADNQALQSRLEQAMGTPAQGPALEDMKRTLVRMNQQYDALKAENDRLRSQQASVSRNPSGAGLSDADLQNLKKQLGMAQQSLNESIRTINEQNKEIAYLRNQVTDLKAGMDAGSRDQISRLQANVDQKAEKIRQLEQQLAAKSSAAPGAASTQSEVSVLKRQLEQANTQYKRTVDELNQQLTARNQQLQERDRQLTELQTQAGQVGDLQHRLVTLQSELNDARRKSSQLEAELEEVQRKASAPQTTPTSAEALKKRELQIASLQAEITRTKGDLTRVRQELESQKKLAAAKPVTTAPKGNETALRNQVADLTRQLADARRENAAQKKPLPPAPSQTIYKAPVAANPEALKHFSDGKAAMAAGDLAKALDRLNQAQLLDPDNSQFAIEYSMALVEDQRLADSIEFLRRYIHRNPGDRDAYNQLGKIYLMNDQADAASQAFSRAISVSMLNNYATSLKKLNRTDDAETVFKLALKLNPGDSEVLFNLGNLYNAQNKLELARNNYLQAIQIKPDFAEAHYNLGLIYSKMGDKAQAVSHLEQFLRLSPNARNAETIRSYVAKLKT